MLTVSDQREGETVVLDYVLSPITGGDLIHISVEADLFSSFLGVKVYCREHVPCTPIDVLFIVAAHTFSGIGELQLNVFWDRGTPTKRFLG